MAMQPLSVTIDQWRTRFTAISFAIVGAINTVVDVAVLKIGLVFHLNLGLAVALGYFAGMTCGFLLSSRYVFEKDYSRDRYLKFAVISLIGFSLTELIVESLSGWQHIASPLMAKGVAVVLVFFWNYFMSKKWAFK